MKSRIVVGEDDLDLEEQNWSWLALNPEVGVLGQTPVEIRSRGETHSGPPRCEPWITRFQSINGHTANGNDDRRIRGDDVVDGVRKRRSIAKL